MANGKLKSSEKNVAKIFESCGFNIRLNAEIEGLRVDLFAQKDLPDVQKDFKVACIFKYEHSESEVRELIIKLRDNKEKIKANKVLIIVFGIEVMGEDRQMAEENDILIWENDDLKDYLEVIRKDRGEGIKKLNGELGIREYIDPNISKQVPEGRCG